MVELSESEKNAWDSVFSVKVKKMRGIMCFQDRKLGNNLLCKKKSSQYLSSGFSCCLVTVLCENIVFLLSSTGDDMVTILIKKIK